LHRLLSRQPQRVVIDGALHRLTHLRRRLEVSVRGHEAIDALMRALKVVGIDEEPQPPLAITKVRKHRLGQKLLPERLPEALHLAQRLRVLRPALDVPNALPPQLRLECRLPTPRRVLPPVVRQHLLGRPVRCDAAVESLQHQHRLLLMRHRVRDDVAAVVVHEDRHVQPLVAAQQKREDVRLP